MDSCLFLFSNYANPTPDLEVMASLSMPSIPPEVTHEAVAELCCFNGFSFLPFYSHANDGIETSSRIVAHLTISIVRGNKILDTVPIEDEGIKTIVSSTIAIVSAILDHGNKQYDGWEAELIDSKILKYATDSTTIFMMIPAAEAKKYVGVGHDQSAIDHFDYICIDLFFIIGFVLHDVAVRYVKTMSVPKDATIN